MNIKTIIAIIHTTTEIRIIFIRITPITDMIIITEKEEMNNIEKITIKCSEEKEMVEEEEEEVILTVDFIFNDK